MLLLTTLHATYSLLPPLYFNLFCFVVNLVLSHLAAHFIKHVPTHTTDTEVLSSQLTEDYLFYWLTGWCVHLVLTSELKHRRFKLTLSNQHVFLPTAKADLHVSLHMRNGPKFPVHHLPFCKLIRQVYNQNENYTERPTTGKTNSTEAVFCY